MRLSARSFCVVASVCLFALGAPGAPAHLRAQSASEPPSTRQEILLRQRQTKAEHLVPEEVTRWESRLLGLQKLNFPQSLFAPPNGVYPIVGGLPSGSGFVLGAGLVRGANSERMRVALEGRYSFTNYKGLNARVRVPGPASDLPLRLDIDLGYLDLRSVSFYGLGNESSRHDLSSYAFESREANIGLRYAPHPLIRLRARGGFLDGNLGAGHKAPSFDARFRPADIPGSLEQPQFFTYGAGLSVGLRDQRLRSAGVTLAVDAERFAGRDNSRFDFTRVVGELQAHVPLGHRNRMLAFRFRTSHSLPEPGATVPVYLMETIGGAKTLRGLPEYRYYDTRNLLMNLEYRWEVWNYLDFVFFGDAGKVFAETRQFNLTDLQASYGFGVRTVLPGGGGFRVDVARSHEGIKVHFSGGPAF